MDTFQNMSVAESFLRPLAEKRAWLPPFVVLCMAVFIWSAVGLGPYSGYNTPPQFGDFEAQRHWMEITQHLDPRQWYFYDFDWWRLDYPPLTAFHSWLCGKVGAFFTPDWFALDTSRGAEDQGLKAFMRASVVVSQLAVYAAPAYVWTRQAAQHNSMAPTLAWASLLLFPCLTIIDHGHFQYNAVMLGLCIGSFDDLVRRRFILASLLFVLALFFKQMALYYAPVMFTAILGFCIGPAVGWELQLTRLITVGVTVLGTAALLLIPFFDLDQLAQIVTRVFPVFRGLWEDKVANLWCTINFTGFKLKAHFSPQQLQLMALGATLAAILPSCIAEFVGKPRVFVWALASCAWAFFLFSFQVHEKSVLLPLLPTMMAAVQHYKSANIRAMTMWVSNVAYFSMWPLLKREGLHLQYFVLIALYNWLFTERGAIMPRNWLNKLVVFGSYAGIFGITMAEHFIPLPAELGTLYPDLLVVGNMALSFVCFAYFWLWQSWYMLTLTTIDNE